MVMIGQLAIEAAFAAITTGDLQWLHVLAAVDKLFDNALILLQHTLFSSMPMMPMNVATTGSREPALHPFMDVLGIAIRADVICFANVVLVQCHRPVPPSPRYTRHQ